MRKVLVINDCKFERFVIKDCLNAIGYNVEIASEYDALSKVKKFQPDILIANLIMKNTTGDNLIKKIKAENSQIICILSSCDSIKLQDYVKNNVDEVIHTPIDKTVLSEILNKVTGTYGIDEANKKSVSMVTTKELSKDSIKEQEAVPLDGKCNAAVSKFSFCPFCGQKLNEISQSFCFCPYCGQKLQSD